MNPTSSDSDIENFLHLVVNLCKIIELLADAINGINFALQAKGTERAIAVALGFLPKDRTRMHPKELENWENIYSYAERYNISPVYKCDLHKKSKLSVDNDTPKCDKPYLKDYWVNMQIAAMNLRG